MTTSTVRKERRGEERHVEVPIEESQWPYRVETSVAAERVSVVLSPLQCVTQTNTPVTVQNETTRSPSLVGSIVMGGIGAGLVGIGGWTWGRRDQYPAICSAADPDCTTRDKAETTALTLGVLGAVAIGYGVINLFGPSNTETAPIESREEATTSTPHPCPTPITNIALELRLPSGPALQATTDNNGRASFALSSDVMGLLDARGAALFIGGQPAVRDVRVDAIRSARPTPAIASAPHAVATRGAQPSLGVASPSDGCIAGYVYAVADGNPLDTDYSDSAPVQTLWNCGWNVSVPQGQLGLEGLRSGSTYAVRHQGLFNVAIAGRYAFPTQASHGYRMRVDGQPVEAGAAIDLSAGQHAMVVEYVYPAGAQFNFNIEISLNGAAPQPWTFDRRSPYYAEQGVRYVGEEPLDDNYESLARVDDEEIRITEQIHFKTGSDEIIRDDSSEAVLFAVAKVLNDHPELSGVEIQGHTDDQGNAAANLDLSNRRARAVRQWLIDAGIAPHRLRAQGYGKTKPVANNRTDDGRALNRRVQFVIQDSRP